MNTMIGRIAKAAVLGTVMAYLTSVILILLFAFIMLKLQPGTEVMEVLVLVIYGLSALVGGRYAGKKGQKRKFLHGLLVGLIYFLLLFLISGMAEEQLQPELGSSLAALVLCAAGGMLGGMTA